MLPPISLTLRRWLHFKRKKLKKKVVMIRMLFYMPKTEWPLLQIPLRGLTCNAHMVGGKSVLVPSRSACLTESIELDNIVSMMRSSKNPNFVQHSSVL